MKVFPQDAVIPIRQATHAATTVAKPGASALFGVAAVWNTTMDMLFYDVRALTPVELAKLSGQLLAQGTVLIVQPGGWPEGIEVIGSDDFIAAQESGKSTIKTLAVPGVGSTAVAAAALARNAADALGEPVAAIVPGYGAVDLLADACGGWYVLGTNNRLLDLAAQAEALGLEKSAEMTGAAADVTPHNVEKAGFEWPSPLALLLNEAPEVDMLQRLFAGRNNIKLLVGHSKGCLSLAFALNAVARRKSSTLRPDLHAVTLGCVTYFPKGVKKAQFLGELDMLGSINSRRDLEYMSLPGKMHSLNSLFPTSVNVGDVLRKAGLARR